jgi:hypothetical protein
MMCQTTEGDAIQIDAETPTASRGTHFAKENGVSLLQSVLMDVAQILYAPFASVPRIHLWI